MDAEQQKNLIELVDTNEQFKSPRVLIDYAISLATSFANQGYEINKEMTDYVEKLYKEKYDVKQYHPNY